MNKKRKVALVSSSYAEGGAEKSTALLSFILEESGFEVYNILMNDKVKYAYTGKLLNLGKKVSFRLLGITPILKGIYLFNYLRSEKIEIIIDNRTRPNLIKELFTTIIYGKIKQYFVVRSSCLNLYFPKSSLFVKNFYKPPVRLVCVSKTTAEKITATYRLTNTFVIYNPVITDYSTFPKPENLPQNYFLFYGRIEDEVKNLSLLIAAYASSNVVAFNYHLLIIGDGKDYLKLQLQVQKLNLENYIHFIPFQNHIEPYIQNAFATVLTSKFEGFPRSIIESLALGTPVISVDCESGPSEIIQHEQNGLLVTNQDVNAFAQAMHRMVSDNHLYENCKKNACKSVEHLSLEKIARQWQQLLSKNDVN